MDVASVGNHEFDRGTDELRRIQSGGCERYTRRDPCAVEAFEGAEFSYLAANVVAEDGSTLLPATAMRDVDGVRIGFVGMTLQGTPDLVANSATAGYRFLDEAETANRYAAELRRDGADAVVLLIHQGAEISPEFTTNACPLAGGDLVPIVAALDPSVSMVVSGHTHDAYTCMLPNGAGEDVLVTSGGRYGGFVTDIALTIDPATDTILSANARNVPVDGSAGTDDAISAYVARYAAAAGPVANRAIGTIADTGVLGEDCADRPEEGFIADAYYHGASAALGEPIDFAIVNSGGVRTDLSGASDGVLTYGELAAMAPFGNGLIVLELTGAQVKALLEQQFETENGAGVVRDSALIPSRGMAWTVDLSRPDGQRIVGLTLDGEPLDPSRTYRMATNSFVAAGGDGFSVLADIEPLANAGFDIDAIEAYVAAGRLTVPICGRVRGIRSPEL